MSSHRSGTVKTRARAKVPGEQRNWIFLGPIGPASMVKARWRVVQVISLLWATLGAVFMETKFAQWDPTILVDGSTVPTHGIWSVSWALLVCTCSGLLQILYTEYTERALDPAKRRRVTVVVWGVIAAWGASNLIERHRQHEGQ